MIGPLSRAMPSCTRARHGAAAVRRRRPARPAGLAQAGLDGSRTGSRATRGCVALVAKDRGFTEDDKALLRAVELESAHAGRPGVPRRRRAGTGRAVDARRSITRFCRCCATPTRHCGRSRTRRRPRTRFARPGDARAQVERARRVSRGDVRQPAHGHVAVGRVGVGRGRGADGRGRRRLDGHRRGHPVAVARRALPRDGFGHAERPDLLYRPYRVGDARARWRCSATTRCRTALAFTTSRGTPAAAAADFVERVREAGRRFRRGDRRGRGDRQRDPGRRERLGALRGRRPAVPARAVSARSSAPPTSETVTMAEAAAGPATAAAVDLPGLLDQRRLLHLDRPPRRPSGLVAAGRGPRGVRPRMPPPCRAGGPRPGVRGTADCRRQRLVLVVRRRPFVGPRRGVRRAVPAPLRNAYAALGAADSG